MGVILIRNALRIVIFVAFGFAFSACAHLATQVPADRVWQSEARVPVWIRHPPGPAGSFFYLVREGVSDRGEIPAAKKAERRIAVFLADRFRTFQYRLSDSERESLIRGWMDGMETKKGPLFATDRWAYRKKTDPDNPFRLESHVWVLVKVPSDLISALRKHYSVQDRFLLRTIERTHERMIVALDRKNGFSGLLFLAQNREAFRRIHSFRSFSGRESRHLNDIYLKESESLAQFFETVRIAPPQSFPAPIPIRVSPFRAFELPLGVSFSMGKDPLSLSHVRPVIEIRPRPEKDPFPPLPLYQRGREVRKSPIRWTALVWASDLERFQREIAKQRLAYDCPGTNRDGATVCRVRQMPVFPEGSRLDMKLEGERNQNYNSPEILNGILGRVRSRIAILPEDSRRIHRLRIRIDDFEDNVGAVAKKALERALSKKGYLLESADRRGRRTIVRTETLSIRLIPRTRRHTLPGGTVVVEMGIRYDASVLGPDGTLLWEGRGFVLDVGIDPGEALREASDSLSGRISNALDPVLWPRPDRPDISRFQTLRYPILDGLALCSGESS